MKSSIVRVLISIVAIFIAIYLITVAIIPDYSAIFGYLSTIILFFIGIIGVIISIFSGVFSSILSQWGGFALGEIFSLWRRRKDIIGYLRKTARRFRNVFRSFLFGTSGKRVAVITLNKNEEICRAVIDIENVLKKKNIECEFHTYFDEKIIENSKAVAVIMICDDNPHHVKTISAIVKFIPRMNYKFFCVKCTQVNQFSMGDGDQEICFFEQPRNKRRCLNSVEELKKFIDTI